MGRDVLDKDGECEGATYWSRIRHYTVMELERFREDV